MTAIGTLVDRYFAVWNEADPVRRHELMVATWSEDAGYLDPMFAATGHDALDALVTGVHAQFPGHRFRLTGAVDNHRDRARWSWELVGPDGAPVVAGVDFAVLAPDGRLREVTGFFEPPAAAS
ncbi:MAG: nuclear transport factor 2 family protein [Chloroflexota bacterium]|nr:nuclear transport factor 2 family protein [Chloroflexota bacterium]